MFECERFHPTRKSSKRRRMSSLPTDTKRRSSTLTEPVKEITFCTNDVTSPIDELFSPLPDFCSTICEVFRAQPFKFLAAKISQNPSDFLDTAKLHLNHFLKLVEGIPIPSEVANSLLRGVWLNPCFVCALAEAIDVHGEEIIGNVMGYSNEDSVDDRIARMQADPYFKPSVMGLKEPTSVSTLIRLFSSILISHWCDRGLLRMLDQRMGKEDFGRRLDLIAKMRALRATELAGKKDKKVERFSFVTEDVSRVKDVESLRKMLVERYGSREDIDVEAILKEMQSDIRNVQHFPCYVGKKMEIMIKLTDGCYKDFGISLITSDKAS